MKNLVAALGVACALGASLPLCAAAQDADPPPPWAWGFTTPPPAGTPVPTPASAAAAQGAPAKPNPAREVKHTLQGAKTSFNANEANNRYGPADWFPEEHPALPPIVAHGRE